VSDTSAIPLNQICESFFLNCFNDCDGRARRTNPNFESITVSIFCGKQSEITANETEDCCGINLIEFKIGDEQKFQSLRFDKIPIQEVSEVSAIRKSWQNPAKL
jgi:hypothetical protein